MINIILCGGSGTRLWPISRRLFPKQFCKFVDKTSLFQDTVNRNIEICDHSIIVTNDEQYFMAVDQLEEINYNKYSFLLESVQKNTAPAIALACMTLDRETIVFVSPSDHVISNQENYLKILEKAKIEAEKDNIIIFGIKPKSAKTEFGYIELDKDIENENENENSNSIYNVKNFREKPDKETANFYYKSNKYFWNSGMFIFKAGVFLDELKRHSPDIYKNCMVAIKNNSTLNKKNDNNNYPISQIPDMFIRIEKQYMNEIPSDSIDYAVMEKSHKIKMIIADVGWNDLGSFDALNEYMPKDNNNNTSNKDALYMESNNNLVISTEKRMISTLNVDNMIIIDTPDALLVSKKGSSEKIRDIVDILKKNKSELSNIHLTVHRPWGTYTVLEEGYRYKIKNVMVRPGKKLSLQKHMHRSEHWVVVNGTAIVTLDDKEIIVKPNESIYISIGTKHRLENSGKIPLVLIEVQVGDYLGEDDILRFEDDFGRN